MPAASQYLEDKRALITQADAFVGPVLCEVFREHGATVIADTQTLADPEAPSARVAARNLLTYSQ